MKAMTQKLTTQIEQHLSNNHSPQYHTRLHPHTSAVNHGLASHDSCWIHVGRQWWQTETAAQVNIYNDLMSLFLT